MNAGIDVDAGSSECADCPPECASDSSDLIYVLGDQYSLSTFDPTLAEGGADPFTTLGGVRCNDIGSPLPGLSASWAYSMASDRYGYLWIYFTSGEIFKVDVKTLSCTKTEASFDKLALMAFGGPDRSNESLFMSLNPPDSMSRAVYAEVNPTTFEIGTPHEFADATGSLPSLSGTSDGRMLGFRPLAGDTGVVESLNIATGGTLQSWEVADHGRSSMYFWTAAFWGGKHYIFSTSENVVGNRTSRIGVFDPKKPEGERLSYLDADIVQEISLASASTCAPPSAP